MELPDEFNSVLYFTDDVMEAMKIRIVLEREGMVPTARERPTTIKGWVNKLFWQNQCLQNQLPSQFLVHMPLHLFTAWSCTWGKHRKLNMMTMSRAPTATVATVTRRTDNPVTVPETAVDMTRKKPTRAPLLGKRKCIRLGTNIPCHYRYGRQSFGSNVHTGTSLHKLLATTRTGAKQPQNLAHPWENMHTISQLSPFHLFFAEKFWLLWTQDLRTTVSHWNAVLLSSSVAQQFHPRILICMPLFYFLRGFPRPPVRG